MFHTIPQNLEGYHGLLFIYCKISPIKKSKIFEIIRLQRILMRFEPQFSAHNQIKICLIQSHQIWRGYHGLLFIYCKISPPQKSKMFKKIRLHQILMRFEPKCSVHNQITISYNPTKFGGILWLIVYLLRN